MATRKFRLFNALTREIEPLTASNGRILWYACGPTVYDDAHLGHARTYVTHDILHRVLTKYFRYDVFYVMGMTDVDDKIIAAANKTATNPLDFARHFEQRFLKDMESLNVRRPDAVVRVSEHIEDIVAYIKQIQTNGFAYEAQDGVYFDTTAMGSQYGRLDPNETKKSEISDSKKKNVKDFALWKVAKPQEPSWSSPWGGGRPGWHIECSAMIHQMFGRSFDLHTGGIDLCFPHHNNEIAQSEAFNDDAKPWCSTFAHCGHLYIKGMKMSKSLKNFITIRELLETVSADQFRMFCLQYSYRSNLHYSLDRMDEARVLLQRVDQFLSSVDAFERQETTLLMETKWKDMDFQVLKALETCKRGIQEALEDDFDTPRALTVLFDLISTVNQPMHQQQVNIDTLRMVSRFILDLLDVFGLDQLVAKYRVGCISDSSSNEQAILDELVEFRHKVRMEARMNGSKDKLLKFCDEIRRSMLTYGIQIDDVDEKSIWKMVLSPPSKEKKTTASLKFEEYIDIRPEDLFQLSPQYKGLYSQFDQTTGMPTHDAEGQELSKSLVKKLTKKREKHLKLRQRHGFLD